MRSIPRGVPGKLNKTVHLAALLSLSLFWWVMHPAALAVSSALPQHIRVSFTENPASTLTIIWQAPVTAASGRVQYLPAADYSGSFTGALEVSAFRSEFSSEYSSFEATLRGLSFNTGYIYRVGEEDAWSEPARFTTAGTGQEFSFLYMGDIQDGLADWGNMLREVWAENPELKFILLGGDLINEGNSPDEWQTFFDHASPVSGSIPLMPAAGNHDDTPLFWNNFALPRNGPTVYTEKIYSFNYANCHFVVLDSNELGALSPDYGRISSWLLSDLDSCGQRWRVILLHYPPYPVVEDAHSENLQENWVPLWEAHGVDLVLSGHQHVYMRSKPLRANQICSDGAGIVYIMGNAGTKYYTPSSTYDYIACEASNNSNYQLINISGDTLTLQSKDQQGNLFDRYVLHKKTSPASYILTPAANPAYQSEISPEGILCMTVNPYMYGLKYFALGITPERTHSGTETLVFVHLRNGVQLGLNVSKTDFDLVHSAQAGFNVLPGDTVKVYIADDLNNTADFNPTILQ